MRVITLAIRAPERDDVISRKIPTGILRGKFFSRLFVLGAQVEIPRGCAQTGEMGRDLRDRSIWLARHVLPHEPLLRARLRAIPVYDLDVEDIIQETYTRMLSVPSLESIRYPKQYALLTARAVIVDHMRQSRVVSIVSSDQFESLEVAEPSASVEQRLEIRDEVVEVAAALEKLPKLSREILILRRVEGISQKDVAQRLAISEKTVEKHMTAGIRRLVKTFGRGGKTRPRPSYHQSDNSLQNIRVENDADK